MAWKPEDFDKKPSKIKRQVDEAVRQMHERAAYATVGLSHAMPGSRKIEDDPAPKKQWARPNKYNAQKCEHDGLKFDSKLERDIYLELERMVANGDIPSFIRQVSIPTGNASKYRMRPDFLVIIEDGIAPRVLWIDAKGRATRDWTAKQDAVRQIFGIEVIPVGSTKALREAIKEARHAV